MPTPMVPVSSVRCDIWIPLWVKRCRGVEATLHRLEGAADGGALDSGHHLEHVQRELAGGAVRYAGPDGADHVDDAGATPGRRALGGNHRPVVIGGPADAQVAAEAVRVGQ